MLHRPPAEACLCSSNTKLMSKKPKPIPITILTGFPLGYWLASQASITVFVSLIFTYALIMNNIIDRKYGFEEEE